MESVNEKWEKYTEINNTSYDVIDNNGSIAIVIKDFLKYPDKFSEFLRSFPHWDNYRLSTARPGKTFAFNIDFTPVAAEFIASAVANTLISNISCTGMHTNCLNGNMKGHYFYPHVDSDLSNRCRNGAHIAANLGLTKDLRGGTSFWKFNGKRSPVDMSLEEENVYKSHARFDDRQVLPWEQVQSDENWELTHVVPIEYNSLVMYSSLEFHNPYLKDDWFIDTDRFTLAVFFEIVSFNHENLDTETKNKLFDIWKGLHLCKIFNYYF